MVTEHCQRVAVMHVELLAIALASRDREVAQLRQDLHLKHQDHERRLQRLERVSMRGAVAGPVVSPPLLAAQRPVPPVPASPAPPSPERLPGPLGVTAERGARAALEATAEEATVTTPIANVLGQSRGASVGSGLASRHRAQSPNPRPRLFAVATPVGMAPTPTMFVHRGPPQPQQEPPPPPMLAQDYPWLRQEDFSSAELDEVPHDDEEDYHHVIRSTTREQLLGHHRFTLSAEERAAEDSGTGPAPPPATLLLAPPRPPPPPPPPPMRTLQETQDGIIAQMLPPPPAPAPPSNPSIGWPGVRGASGSRRSDFDMEFDMDLEVVDVGGATHLPLLPPRTMLREGGVSQPAAWALGAVVGPSALHGGTQPAAQANDGRSETTDRRREAEAPAQLFFDRDASFAEAVWMRARAAPTRVLHASAPMPPPPPPQQPPQPPQPSPTLWQHPPRQNLVTMQVQEPWNADPWRVPASAVNSPMGADSSRDSANRQGDSRNLALRSSAFVHEFDGTLVEESVPAVPAAASASTWRPIGRLINDASAEAGSGASASANSDISGEATQDSGSGSSTTLPQQPRATGGASAMGGPRALDSPGLQSLSPGTPLPPPPPPWNPPRTFIS